jgi:phosphoglycerate dehydrogenase-like enzyme
MATTHRFPLWRYPAWLPARVKERFPQFNVVHLDSYEGLDREIADAEVFVGFFLKPESFALARELRYIHVTAAGVNQLCYPALIHSPVILTNASSVMAVPVAEHTMALILAMAKRFPSAMRYQAQSYWAQTEVALEQPTIQELKGATLGLVGLGSIGQELVTRARAFGMRIVAVKRDATTGQEWADRVLPRAALHEMLGEADYVIIAAPQTESTHRMMGAAEFAAMKSTAYLINVARGALVDEQALFEALTAKRIAGAACDVFEPEPLAAESPLWKAPNMFITPHLAATTGKLWSHHAELLEDNISRYLDGRPLRNVVDKHSGY